MLFWRLYFQRAWELPRLVLSHLKLFYIYIYLNLPSVRNMLKIGIELFNAILLCLLNYTLYLGILKEVDVEGNVI